MLARCLCNQLTARVHKTYSVTIYQGQSLVGLRRREEVGKVVVRQVNDASKKVGGNWFTSTQTFVFHHNALLDSWRERHGQIWSNGREKKGLANKIGHDIRRGLILWITACLVERYLLLVLFDWWDKQDKVIVWKYGKENGMLGDDKEPWSKTLLFDRHHLVSADEAKRCHEVRRSDKKSANQTTKSNMTSFLQFTSICDQLYQVELE